MSEAKELKRRKVTATAPVEDEANDAPATKEVHEPMDVALVKHILESMGVDKYEPRVVTQLLEFVHRYTTDVLVDAQEYSQYANKAEIDADDVRLAAMSRLNHAYAQMPARELMMELAEKRNAIPLPLIPNEYGVRLPPPELQLATDQIPFMSPHQQQHLMHHHDERMVDHASPATHHPPTTAQPRGSRNIKFSASPIPISFKTTSV
ncbi:hypothetical protein SPRG_19927 [Saprolegnia parasitica CBS 223.65]|uniref:Transcription initiation factor TFIID subunit 9B n=1 Tax=Saprolegnia parasitica (strain CBS 223.65) TaxID=695850 RepID=A0A067CR45_SAPPC|nr:hypothetical protein SPRG_19927 [Saprolegnia parasitica CBS 223.65]KDO29267.1 hypothetical protein SPRG_19927 [Saprolegnia parasitica CBS 223.65]|eukprot:XP_012200152.1 hypothetical protein SPRG_19927 [Saprolegnia parasitica CBS 223.65]